MTSVISQNVRGFVLEKREEAVHIAMENRCDVISNGRGRIRTKSSALQRI